MTGDRGLLREKHGHGHHRVGFIELFFDLVFVFAVTQLSHLLIEHFTPLGAVETLLLLLAVWWVWVYTVWATNWLDPDKVPVRVMLMVLALLGIIMAAAIPRAFESRGLAFAIAYVAMQVGRTWFFIWAVRGHPEMRRNFQRIVSWLMLGAAFWLLGGWLEGAARLAAWSAALGLEFISPMVGFWVPVLGRSRTVDWDVEGGHMAERCGLFIIIALGESLLVTGATFSGLEWTSPAILALIASFAGSLAMWWLYFDTSAEVGTKMITGARDPGRVARLAYTYLHLFMVAGIIVSAVGDEFVLAHPTGHSDLRTTIAVLGGAGAYLLGIALFRAAITGRLPRAPLVSMAALVVLAVAAGHLPPVVLAIGGTLVLVAAAAWEVIPSG